jgi:antitoxin component of MazEF toxin-antitoxin module
MLEAVGRVIATGRSTAIRIPADVARDSAFPFKTGDEVVVQIRDGELRIRECYKQ